MSVALKKGRVSMADIDEISRAIGRMEARMEAGDRRFDTLEKCMNEMSATLSETVTVIRENKASSRTWLAAIGLGSGIAGSKLASLFKFGG